MTTIETIQTRIDELNSQYDANVKKLYELKEENERVRIEVASIITYNDAAHSEMSSLLKTVEALLNDSLHPTHD